MPASVSQRQERVTIKRLQSEEATPAAGSPAVARTPEIKGLPAIVRTPATVRTPAIARTPATAFFVEDHDTKNVKMIKNEESMFTLSWELLRSITSQGIGSLSLRIRTSPT
jgi:hypothetical protein